MGKRRGRPYGLSARPGRKAVNIRKKITFLVTQKVTQRDKQQSTSGVMPASEVISASGVTPASDPQLRPAGKPIKRKKKSELQKLYELTAESANKQTHEVMNEYQTIAEQPRSKRTPAKKPTYQEIVAGKSSTPPDVVIPLTPVDATATAQSPLKSVSRGRGRPRKIKPDETSVTPKSSVPAMTDSQNQAKEGDNKFTALVSGDNLACDDSRAEGITRTQTLPTYRRGRWRGRGRGRRGRGRGSYRGRGRSASRGKGFRHVVQMTSPETDDNEHSMYTDTDVNLVENLPSEELGSAANNNLSATATKKDCPVVASSDRPTTGLSHVNKRNVQDVRLKGNLLKKNFHLFAYAHIYTSIHIFLLTVNFL